jgi:hypothetical protein
MERWFPLRTYNPAAVLIMFLFIVNWSGNQGSDIPQRKAAAENDAAFEATQTEKLLGVAVQNFPEPQGLGGFDELSTDTPPFRFTVTERRLSGAKPRLFFLRRRIVAARAPDGSVYEAFCGNDDEAEITPGHGFVSTFENRRQPYGTHFGYEYQPQNVYIGKRQAGKIIPTLFFRDVGSHITAPHHLAIDNQGKVHLAVADVNIFQDNQLDLYWVIGDPKSGKWNSAWLIDRRGFTGASHPWSGAWGDKVHLLWDWTVVGENVSAPGTGVFYLEWGSNGLGRKIRVVTGRVNGLAAAIDSRSGRLLIVLGRDDGVYVLSRLANGNWSGPVLLHPSLNETSYAVSVHAVREGAFIIRTGSEKTKEWLLVPA